MVRDHHVERFLNAIIAGNARLVMKKIPRDSIDLVVTSPPYNFNKPYATHDDGLDMESYFNVFLLPTWKEATRVLKPGGRMVVNVQSLWSEHVKTHEIIGKQLEDLGLLFYDLITWNKKTLSDGGKTAWGSWKSPQYPRVRYCTEFILVHAKETRRKRVDSAAIDFFGSEDAAKDRLEDITEDEFKAFTMSPWEFKPETAMKKMGHPAMFPEELPYRVMRLYSRIGDIVLDPFCGLGTTALVAWKLHRRFIGIDISKKYCKKALDRVRNVSNQQKLVDPRADLPFAYPRPRVINGIS